MAHPYRFTPLDIVIGVLTSVFGGERVVSGYYYNHPSIDSTFSAVRTDKLDEVCNEINNLAELLNKSLDEYKEIILAARIKSEDFPGFAMPIGKHVDIYDFADILSKNTGEKIKSEIYNASQNLKKSLDEAVIANWAQVGHKNAHGLSLFFPYSKNYTMHPPHWDMKNYTTHKLEFKDNSYWDEFLVNYLDS